jgi:hypothetical protein
MAGSRLNIIVFMFLFLSRSLVVLTRKRGARCAAKRTAVAATALKTKSLLPLELLPQVGGSDAFMAGSRLPICVLPESSSESQDKPSLTRKFFFLACDRREKRVTKPARSIRFEKVDC